MIFTPSQPLVPKSAPYECCRLDANLTPFEVNAAQPGPVEDPNTGEIVVMVTGLRRCKTCGRRHHFARPSTFFIIES